MCFALVIEEKIFQPKERDWVDLGVVCLFKREIHMIKGVDICGAFFWVSWYTRRG